MLSLGEETKDADKEVLPVQPDRHTKASAEERLGTVPDLENAAREICEANPPPPSSLRVSLFIVGGGQQRELGLLVQKTEIASWVWKGLFLDQLHKHVLQTEAPEKD